MTAAALLASLRSRGISIATERGRLILDAPEGVVTLEMRGELGRNKAEIITVLEDEAHSRDSTLASALNEITGLLALAYGRHQQILHAGGRDGKDFADTGLANPGRTSVHGDVS